MIVIFRYNTTHLGEHGFMIFSIWKKSFWWSVDVVKFLKKISLLIIICLHFGDGMFAAGNLRTFVNFSSVLTMDRAATLIAWRCSKPRRESNTLIKPDPQLFLYCVIKLMIGLYAVYK